MSARFRETPPFELTNVCTPLESNRALQGELEGISNKVTDGVLEAIENGT